MNTFTGSNKDIEQLMEILEERIPREHHGKHGREGSSTTLHNFFDMLGTILQANYGQSPMGIRPESITVSRNPFEGYVSLAHPMIFSSSI
jgi:hypothetical protein